MGQQAVLLGLVEAMDLVDEQDRPAAVHGQPLSGGGDGRADVGDTGEDCRQGHKAGRHGIGQDPGQGRLAGSRWAPQEEGAQVSVFGRATERPTLPDKVGLADKLGKRARSHPGGQGLAPRRGLEEGTLFGHGSTDGHAASLRAGPNRTGSDPKDVADLDEEIQHEHRGEQRATHDRDTSDVRCHVGIFLRGGGRKRA